MIVEHIFNSIVRALDRGDKVEIRGFGSFRTRQRRARIGHNPKTGVKVDVPAKRIAALRPVTSFGEYCRNTDPFYLVGDDAVPSTMRWCTGARTC